MSYTMDAVRLVNVGQASAQLTDLTLPFSDSDGPVESVIWLKNGGGKSSIIALTSAVVLPRKHDFTGSGRDSGRSSRPRQLEDYVLDGTGHTVIAWSQPSGDLYGSRRQLLTGAVYEWPERRRPGSHATGRDVEKWWWAAVPNTTVSLTSVPVRSGAHGTGAQLTSAQFKDRLKQLNTDDPSLQVRIFPTMKEWAAFLESAGIDTALYRYQAKMNMSEGGIADIFTFSSAREFVNFVLDIVAAPSQAEECAEILTRHAENLFARPALLLEQRFLGAAESVLADLAAAHELVRDAAAQLGSAEHAAVQLRRGLLVGAALRQRRAAEARERQQLLQARLQQARSDRKAVEDIRDELLRLAAVAELRHAEERVELAAAARGATHAQERAWTAAEDLLLEASELARAAQLTEQLRPERQQRAALAADHDAFATAYQLQLRAELHDVRAQEQSLAAEKAQEDKEHRDAQRSREAARNEGRRADRAFASAHAAIGAYLAAVRDAVTDGVLHGQLPASVLSAVSEADAELDPIVLAALPDIAGVQRPDDAAAHHEQTRLGHNQRAERLREEAGAARKDAAAAAERAAGHDKLGAAADVKAEQAAEAVQHLEKRRDVLANDARLVALVEADGPINVWDEAGALRSALTTAIRTAHAQVLADAVAAADADRLMSEVDTNGLLPSPVGVDEVVRHLSTAGVTAETAWRVLVRDHGPRLGPAGLRTFVLNQPDVACAVVVQDDNAREHALALTASEPTLLYLPLVTSAHLAAAVDAVPAPGAAGSSPVTTAGATIVPLHEGLWSEAAAAAAADQARSVGAARAARRQHLEAQAETDGQLRTELDAFLRENPVRDAVEAAQAARDELVAMSAEHRAAAAAERERAAELRADAEELDVAAEQARHDARAAASLRDAARGVARRGEQVPEQRTQLEAADAARRAAADAEAYADARLIELAEQARQRAATGERLSGRREHLNKDLLAVRTVQDVPPAPEPLPAPAQDEMGTLLDADGHLVPGLFWQRVEQLRTIPVVEVAARWDELSRQWTARAGQSVLEAQMEAASKAAARHRERASSVLDGHAGTATAEHNEACREEATRIATTASMTVAQIRAGLGEAQQRAQAAVAAEAEAKAVRQRAEETLAGRTPSDRPRYTSADVGFTTVEEAVERAAVLSAQATEMSGTETRLDNDAQRAGTRAEVLQAEATRLRDFTAPLVTTPGTGALRAADGRAAEPDTEDGLVESLLSQVLAADPDVSGDEPPDHGSVEPVADASDGFGWWVRLDADLEEVRELVGQAGERVKLAAHEHAESVQERQLASTRALQLAGQPEYQALPLKLRERLADTDPRVQAERAATLAEQVVIRLAQVEAVLTSSAENERAVTKVVGSHVRQLLDALLGASRASRIPAGLHEMSDRQFFTLRFDNPDAAELSDRVAQEVRSILDAADGVQNRLPSGAELLKRCVHASVGARGFTAKVLKPNEHMVAQEVPVTDVSLFSDGEKLTTCILLFCAFARMRQLERRRAQGGSSASAAVAGTLVLDNPFGKASAAELVALQLAVARAQGVHLVFATGLDDMGALLQFRNILRLRNRKASHVPGGFIRHSDVGDGTVTGARVSRPDAPVPPVLLTEPDAGETGADEPGAGEEQRSLRVADDGAA